MFRGFRLGRKFGWRNFDRAWEFSLFMVEGEYSLEVCGGRGVYLSFFGLFWEFVSVFVRFGGKSLVCG